MKMIPLILLQNDLKELKKFCCLKLKWKPMMFMFLHMF